MTSQPLKPYGVYSVANTPYQYVAHPLGPLHWGTGLAWALQPPPEVKGNKRLEAQPLLVNHNDELLDSKAQTTGYTVADLDFTGRYLHEGHTYCSSTCQETSDTEPSTGSVPGSP